MLCVAIVYVYNWKQLKIRMHNTLYDLITCGQDVIDGVVIFDLNRK